MSAAELASALAGLRDLQLPEATGPVPMILPALLVLVAVAIAAAAFVRYRSPRQRALREIAAMRRRNQDLASQGEALLAALRRAAASPGRKRRPMPPGLTGEALLRWLDAHAPGPDRGRFLGGPGRALADLPYRPPGATADPAETTELGELFGLAERWLKANL
jgi:hypothetical protein